MPQQPSMSPEEIDHIARKRAGAKLGWFFHAAVYVAVNHRLRHVRVRFWHSHMVSKTLAGWGLGLALHGASVRLFSTGTDLRERMVQTERERLQRDQDRRDPS